MATGAKRYYLISGEREKGPYTIAQLRTAVAEGTASGASLVRAEEESEEQPLDDLLQATSEGGSKRGAARSSGRNSKRDADDPVADRLASMRRESEARDLAESLLKSGRPAARVFEELVSTGVRPERAKVIIDGILDVLPSSWKTALYVAILIPFVGPWLIVVGSSVMYYAWRGTFPRKAAEINRHGWIAWLLGNVLYGVVYLVLKS